MLTIGEKLRQLRKEHNLSQQDLADQCNITAAAVSRYENGQRMPRSDIIVRIARELNTPVDYLLSSDEGDNDNVKLDSAMQIIGMAQLQNEITPRQAIVLQEIAREVFGEES